MTWRPWQVAWADALYGPAGFYRRPEGPAGHFRTASHASSSGLLGVAVARLARVMGCNSVLDVGAGRGELLIAVHAADPTLFVAGVDVVDRPADLPAGIGWAPTPLAAGPGTLLVAFELLDVVPCPVLEVDAGGDPRIVEVDGAGRERLGGPATAPDLDWCSHWWPIVGLPPGTRVEVGRTRDEAWADLVSSLVGEGCVLAVDYGHLAGSRPVGGTLAGYHRGRQVDPVPDGSTDITAHVALDSVAEAASGATVTTQRSALRRLGVDGAPPEPGLAARDPAGYLAGLSAASEAAELLDPCGLGGFGWVLTACGPRAERTLSDWQAS